MPYRKTARPVHICQCQNHAWTALTQGYITLVSPEDAHIIQERKWTTFIGKKGGLYARTGERRFLHQVILGTKGADHINRNGTDNRRNNLRPATLQQNAANRKNRRPQGFRGVRKLSTRWGARITVESKNVWLGTADTREEAARIYDAAALKYFGEFASLNFPTDVHDHSSASASSHQAESPSALSWQQLALPFFV